MAVIKKVTKKRSYKSNYKRKRYVKPTRAMNSSKSNNSLVSIQTILAPQYELGLGLDLAGNFFFQASQMPSIATYTAMFTQFRLIKVVMRWIPAFKDNLPGNADGTLHPILVAFNPINSTTGVPTLTSIRKNRGIKSLEITRKQSLVFYPKYLVQMSDQVTTYYSFKPANKTWMDIHNTAIRSYGVDWVIQSTGLATGVELGTWEIDYHVEFKDPIL